MLLNICERYTYQFALVPCGIRKVGAFNSGFIAGSVELAYQALFNIKLFLLIRIVSFSNPSSESLYSSLLSSH